MVRVSRTRSRRRASGKLRPGGKGRPLGFGSSRRLENGIAPEETDQGQVTVQARPTAPLVVAQPQLLLPILMEALHGPAPMGQPQLLRQRAAIEPPGPVPFGLARFAG